MAEPSKFAFPNLNTTSGAVTAFLLAENRNPESPGYEASAVLRSMQAMEAVVYNRLASSPPMNFGNKNPQNIFDIIGDPTQYKGFSRTATGVAVDSGRQELINKILDRGNTSNRFQETYQTFLTNVQNVAAPEVQDPFENYGGAYGWRTAGSSAPGAFLVNIPSAPGVIQGNQFYTIKGADLIFVIDSTGSMADDISRVSANIGKIVNKAVEANDFSDAPNVRFGVVTYKDPGETDTVLGFTESALKDKNADDAVKNAVGSISVGGGGDIPEGVYSGLLHALTGAEGLGTWRAAPMTRKIILIGDAPAKDKNIASQVYSLAKQETIKIDEQITPDPGSNLRLRALASDLTLAVEAAPVNIFTVAIGNNPEALTDFREIAEQTQGKAFTAANADDLVDVLLDVIDDAVGDDTDVEIPSILGGFGDDALYGDAGDDIIDGRGGNDQVFGNEGNNTLLGDSGNDSLYGGSSNDTLDGEDGNDQLFGNEGHNTLLGGAGNDTIYGGSQSDLIDGGSGDDLIFANGGDDIILAGPGNDIIYTGSGDDLINGGTGNDTIWLGGGRDTVVLTKDNGVDTINNFQIGQTVFGLTGGLGFTDLSIMQGDGAALIHAGTDLLASVSWVQANSLTADNFITV